MSRAKVKKWTVIEDDLLTGQVQRTQEEGRPPDWAAAAAALPNRSNKDCRKRWHNALAKGLRKGPWTKDEDLKLENAVQQFGEQRWPVVSKEIGTRSADQCAKRWHHFLKPELDRSEWSPEEDTLLLDATNRHGRVWKDLQWRMFPNRSTTNIKNRYVVLTKRRMSQSVASADGCSDIGGDVSDANFMAVFADNAPLSPSTTLEIGPNDGSVISLRGPASNDLEMSSDSITAFSPSFGDLPFLNTSWLGKDWACQSADFNDSTESIDTETTIRRDSIDIGRLLESSACGSSTAGVISLDRSSATALEISGAGNALASLAQVALDSRAAADQDVFGDEADTWTTSTRPLNSAMPIAARVDSRENQLVFTIQRPSSDVVIQVTNMLLQSGTGFVMESR